MKVLLINGLETFTFECIWRAEKKIFLNRQVYIKIFAPNIVQFTPIWIKRKINENSKTETVNCMLYGAEKQKVLEAHYITNHKYSKLLTIKIWAVTI